MSIDWSAPIEAVGRDGTVKSARRFNDGPGDDAEYWPDNEGQYHIRVGEDDLTFANVDGSAWGGYTYRIRNVAPALRMTDLSPETVERMVALVRDMTGNSSFGQLFEEGQRITHSSAHYEEARAINAELPLAVDPDVLIVRKIVADGLEGKWPAADVQKLLDGEHDDKPSIVVPLACLKRGRTLSTTASDQGRG